MANKKCLVYETLGKVNDLQIVEGHDDGFMRLHGVFGVCGIKNGNNRIYDKNNYGKMVEALQNVIATDGCPGELEHPNTMNITLENVSHIIESIEMNNDGTITGTVKLLNTPKGKIAQQIVEGGIPLYISSRGAGSIDESGHVTLSTIKTYDLVGTPGFSQAKLTLKKNQTFECLNESLEDGNLMYAIVEGDDLLDSGDDDDKKDKKDEGDDKDDTKKSDDTKDTDTKDSDSDDKGDDNDDNKNNDNKDATMNDLKEAIDKLTEKVESLQADLHVAQEALTAKDEELATIKENIAAVKPVNYEAIQQWVMEEFAPEYKSEIVDELEDNFNESIESMTDNIATGVQNWVCEEFAPEVQNWVCEEFAPEVQNWVCEEFAPEVQNWVCEEFAPEVEGWIREEYTPNVEGWIREEFAPVIEGWITEEFAPEHKEEIVNEVNSNVSEFLESRKDTKVSEIDNLLEALSNADNTNSSLQQVINEQKSASKFTGVYCVENMPAQYQPQWQMLDEARQNEIVRTSRAYDFTKEGVLEKFWSNVQFKEETSINENHNQDISSNYHANIFARMMALRH